MKLKRQVDRDLHQFPAVAILEPRQSGKTTLTKTIISTRPDALYLDLERPSDLSKLQDAEAFLSMHQDRLVCIDEVQLRPDLFPLLRALIDEHRVPGCFLILGSSSPELSRQSSETLAERLSYIYVAPFDMRELQAANKDCDWRAFLWRGGFPGSYLAAGYARCANCWCGPTGGGARRGALFVGWRTHNSHFATTGGTRLRSPLVRAR